MHTRRKRLAESPNSRDITTRACKEARTSGPSNVRGSGDGNQRHTNGDTHGQYIHQIRVKTENSPDQSSSGESTTSEEGSSEETEESGVDESDTDNNDSEEGFPLGNAPTPNTRTVDRRVIFCFVGHSDDLDLGMGFTPRGQQPGAELFEKAKEYFKTQPDVLYCRVDFEKRLYAFSKDSLEDVDRRINLLEISATNIIGGGQVFIGRDLKLVKRKA
ncbi:hypothetical protein PHISP_02232 [Aspergillus sp. HF37]|nr:hypothetical protein PHISP_02232 [Aspergillus sp. HF37]